MTAAEIVREARRQVGYTQRQLAAAAGVPHSTVARIETSKMDPRVGTLLRLLRACGHTVRLESPWDGDVDRSLIRSQLDLTPRERIESIASTANFVETLRQAIEKAS